MVSGGSGRVTSTRACASLTNRCTAANRCATNALSFPSDSNSSYSTTTNPPSTVSTPPPAECPAGGSTAVRANYPDFTSALVATRSSSANKPPPGGSSNKRYATRGKQKTVQEIIADKEHRSSLPSRHHQKTGLRMRDVAPLRRKPAQKSSILSRIVPKKKVKNTSTKRPKRSEQNTTSKTTVEPQRHSNRLSKLEGCPYTFSEDLDTTADDEPTQPGISAGDGGGVITREVTTPVFILDDTTDETTEVDEKESLPDLAGELPESSEPQEAESLDSGLSIPAAAATAHCKMEIATQTSDTSSYTAEIDPSFLLDENAETDSSDEEEEEEEEGESSQDRDETDTSQTETEGEMLPLIPTGKELGASGASQVTSHSLLSYTAGSLQAVTTLGQRLVGYPVPHMGTSTAVSQPIVTITNCPMTTAPSLLPPVGIGYGAPGSMTNNLAQSGVIGYNGNAFPLQTCTVMGQNLILDDNSRSVLLNDATNQVINNMSVQMQGFSVQHGLSALPLDNMHGMPYIQPALQGINTAAPPQPIIRNTLTAINSSMATPPVAVVHNTGLPLHGNQSIQVNVSTVAIGTHSSVAMGTQCGPVWPQLKKSIQNQLSSAPRSLPSLLPKILPAPGPLSVQYPANPRTTAAAAALSVLAPPPATAHLKRTITCSAAVKVLNVHTAASSPSAQPLAYTTGPSGLHAATSHAVPTRCMLAAQTQSLAYTLSPLPPAAMTTSIQVHLGIACPDLYDILCQSCTVVVKCACLWVINCLWTIDI